MSQTDDRLLSVRDFPASAEWGTAAMRRCASQIDAFSARFASLSLCVLRWGLAPLTLDPQC
jgi:hypothetical protein